MSQIDWIRRTEHGFFCSAGDFFIDPRGPAARAIISHAHGDHYPRLVGEVWCTPATLALARARYGNSAAQIPHAIPFGKTIQIKAVTITFFPAGHILGSAQILLAYQGQHVLYSGDFSLHANPTCSPLTFPDAGIDLLICESTFGEKPHHSNARETLAQAIKIAGLRPLLIGAYPLGKAQHLNRLLHELDPQMPVFVHHEMMKFHKVYAEMGYFPGTYGPFRRQLAKRIAGSYAHIVPPRVLSGFDRDVQHYKVIASGWPHADKKPYLDDQLDFSDHADASEIMAYIHRLKPKSVWFWHGYPGPLITQCEALGIKACEKKASPN